MDGLFTIEDLPLIAFLACAFVFLLFSTIITWLLSKKFPTVWFFNKGLVAICLAVSVAIISGLFLNHYLSSLPSGVFAKVTGFYPTAEIKNLQVISEWNGELEKKRMTFSADRETINKILSRCFYEIPETEALHDMRSEEDKNYLREFTGRPDVHYYERPSHDVEKTGCISDLSDSYIAYDQESQKVYFQWKFVHF